MSLLLLLLTGGLEEPPEEGPLPEGLLVVEWAPTSDPFDVAPAWEDITHLVDQVSTSRGGAGSFSLFSAGQCTIHVKNNTGPVVDPAVWYRWRQVRVTAAGSDVLFRGFIDQTHHQQGDVPFTASATLKAFDLLGILARYEYGAEGVPEEMTGERIRRICDDVGIPLSWRNIATGVHRMAQPSGMLFGVDTPGLLNANALQHAQDCAEAEVGALYVSADGKLTFEDRHTLLNRLDTPAPLVFSDTPSEGEVAYLQGHFPLTPPGRDYRNRVLATGASGLTKTASAVPSRFPPDTLSRTLPMADDNQVEANASYLLEVYRRSHTWPESVVVPVDPGFPDNLAAVPGVELRDHVTVEFTPLGASQTQYPVFVDRVDHEIVPGRWTCTVEFVDAARWESGWGTGARYLTFDAGDDWDGGFHWWP